MHINFRNKKSRMSGPDIRCILIKGRKPDTEYLAKPYIQSIPYANTGGTIKKIAFIKMVFQKKRKNEIHNERKIANTKPY